jgi:photosystem II stability/assembly factor-like uncharacterized protein
LISRSFRAILIVIVCGALCAGAQAPQQQAYALKSVQIVGGGFVDGIIFHPGAPGVRYARTDMGGAYRWDDLEHQWQPMLDWVPYKDLNLMGVESIAVDPSDAKRVYLACGTYTNERTPNGAILRSADGGKRFERTDVPFKLGGNEDGRGNGERMAVDPFDGRVLFLGTRHDGLWRSQDRGVNWMRVPSFPDVTEAMPPMPAPVAGETPEQRWRRMPVRGSGIVFVKFVEPLIYTGPMRPTGTIYVGVSLMNRANLFVSHDAGATWQQVAGAPTRYRPTRAALSISSLYVTYGNAPGPSPMTDGAVWKLNLQTGAWTDITPDKPVKGSREFGYAAVSVDAKHQKTLIVSTYNRYHAGGEDIFRSTDEGATWKPIFTGEGASGGTFDYTLAPYVKPTPIHWLFDIEIDPLNSDHAVFTTGYGGWETFDLTDADRAKPTRWSILAKGIEETVALELDSASEGAHLVSAIGDYGGFVHWDLDKPAPEGASASPRMGNTTGVETAALDPNVIVRVGVSAAHKPGESIGYSLDAGRTWKACASAPTAQSRAGSIAISADGKTWVWTPEREGAFVTRDQGAMWTAVQGLPERMRVIADPLDPMRFYADSLDDGMFYYSIDGAATFLGRKDFVRESLPASVPAQRGDARGGQDRLYATPGLSGDLWLAAFDGLYHASLHTGGSDSFRLPDVTEIHAFGFGKAAPGKSYPALYMVGTISGQAGIFRSDDEAKTWVRINDDQHQWGLVLQIAGDPRIYGRVYVGTHGRGIFYGDLVR